MNDPAPCRSFRPFVRLKPIFNPRECKQVIELAKISGEFKDGLVWNHEAEKFVIDKERRKVQTSYHAKGAETHWIFERMDKAFQAAASQLDLKIKNMSEEDIKIMAYGQGDHFRTWHRDTGANYTSLRGLSMTVELSEQSSYIGGDLQIYSKNSGGFAFETPIGGAVAFLSNVLHRVTPVTSGVRFSLVNWINKAD